MSGVSGDFAALRRMSKGLGLLAKPATRKELNTQLAEEARHLVLECFTKERSPNGVSWRPLQSRKGRALRDSGRLFNSITRTASGRGFRVFTNVKYAATHNYGAVIKPRRAPRLAFRVGNKLVFAKQVTIPKRQFFPSAGELPVSWRRSFERVAKELGRQKMGRR